MTRYAAHSGGNQALMLYRIVFNSRPLFVFTILLVTAFLLQPLEQAFATETTVVTTSETKPEASKLSAEKVEPAPVAEEADVDSAAQSVEPEATETVPESTSSETEPTTGDTTEENDEDDLESPIDDVSDDSDQTSNQTVATATPQAAPEIPKTSTTTTGSSHHGVSSTTSNTGSSQSNAGGSGTNTASDDETVTTGTSSTTATSTSANSTTTLPATTSNSTTTSEEGISDEQNVSTEITQSSSTTSEAQPTETVDKATTSTSSVTNTDDEMSGVAINISDENRHQFSVNDCISVGNGAFYCTEQTSAPTYESDGVFSAPDSDGDLEIFVRVNGEESQLSFNQVDDAAPYYDARSKRIVWHRLVNDRYQVISYDTTTHQETQLTNTDYNNMEAVAFGDVTLWQAWVSDNWEIIKHEAGDIEQLTDNDAHDVAPRMKNGYVVWQTQFNDGWRVAVYDETEKTIEYIDNIDRPTVAENPRFVLVFDQIDHNGDVHTLGYDFENKETIRLGSLPQELQDELPEPDDTGEERALVQFKPTTRESKTTSIDNSNDTDTEDSKNNLATSSTDIIIPAAATTTPPKAVAGEQTETFEPTLTASSTTQNIDIPSVVIPPLATSTDVEAG